MSMQPRGRGGGGGGGGTHKTQIKYDLINGLMDCDIAMISYDVRIGNAC